MTKVEAMAIIANRATMFFMAIGFRIITTRTAAMPSVACTWIEVGTLTSAATRTISSAQRARFALSASESARVPIILAIVPVPTSL